MIGNKELIFTVNNSQWHNARLKIKTQIFLLRHVVLNI